MIIEKGETLTKFDRMQKLLNDSNMAILDMTVHSDKFEKEKKAKKKLRLRRKILSNRN